MAKISKCLGYLLILLSLLWLIIYLKINYSNHIYYNEVYAYQHDSFAYKKPLFILKIDKINLLQPVYSSKSLDNNINKHVKLLEYKNNLIVLAAHSGISSISYFNKLDKLSLKDEIHIINKDYLKTYEIFKRETVRKNGNIKIKKYKYPVIVLTTCSKRAKDKQIIYIGRLKTVEKYNKNTKM